MNLLPKQLRLVSIYSPFDHWQDPQMQRIFCKTVEMRLFGYGAKYRSGFFPLDSVDFISAHHLLCQQSSAGLTPVMGFRSTTWEQSRRFNLPFAGRGILNNGNTPHHLKALDAILSHCDREDIPITYVGAWTMQPDIHKDRELNQLVKTLSMAMLALSHMDTFTRIFAFCMQKFRVDQLLAKWGFSPLALNGEPLPPVGVAFLNQEPGQAMYLKRFNEATLAEAESWRLVWENRLILGENAASVKKGRIAA